MQNTHCWWSFTPCRCQRALTVLTRTLCLHQVKAKTCLKPGSRQNWLWREKNQSFLALELVTKISLNCERQRMLAELKVSESLRTQVAHCRQVTPLKPAHENAPREFLCLPQVIPTKIILVQLFSFCSCAVAYFPIWQWRVQLPASNSEMGSNNCSHEMLGKKPDDWVTFEKMRRVRPVLTES